MKNCAKPPPVTTKTAPKLSSSLKTANAPKFKYSTPKLNRHAITTHAIPSDLEGLKSNLSVNDRELLIETQLLLEQISDHTEILKQLGCDDVERELRLLTEKFKQIKCKVKETEPEKERTEAQEQEQIKRNEAKAQGKKYRAKRKKVKGKIEKEKARRRKRRSHNKVAQESNMSSRFQSSEHAGIVISSNRYKFVKLVSIARTIPDFKTLIEQIETMGADIDKVEESLMKEISKVSKHVRDMKGAGGRFLVTRPVKEVVVKTEKLLVHFYGSCIACLRRTRQLYHKRGDPEKIIYYGTKALQFYLDHYKMYGTQASSMRIANTLHILGYASRELYRYSESSSYLKWSSRNLSELELEASFPAELVSSKLHDTLSELALVETALDSGDEVVTRTKEILEIQEKTMEEHSVEIGWANYAVADAYLRVGNFNEALSFALKALEIYSARLSEVDSVKLAQLKKSLGILSYQLNKYEKFLPSALLLEQMETGNDMLVFGKLEQGIEFMKSVISHATLAGADFTRASAWVASARALLTQGNLGDAKKYMEYAQTIVAENGNIRN